jgi:hypothetical protein
MFRWRPALPSDADRIRQLLVPCQSAFYPDHMLPQVPEIVFIEEAFVRAKVKVSQVYRVRIVAKADATDAADAVVFAPDTEAMQVGVIPAQGDLQGMMQISDGAVAAHQQPAPDQG